MKLIPLAILLLSSALAQASVGFNVYPGPGGNFSVDYGLPIRIEYPSGTFSVTTRGYLTETDLVPQSHTLVAGRAFTIGRPDLQFLKPFGVRISYTNEEIPSSGNEANLNVARYDGHRFLIYNSTVDTGNKYVTAFVNTPGTYCIVSSNSDTHPTDQALLRTKEGTYRLNFGLQGAANHIFQQKFTYQKVGMNYDGFASTVAPTLDSVVTFRRDNFLKLNPYSMNVDGSFSYRIALVNLDEVLAVAYSPNGKSVAYIGERNGQTILFRTDLGGNSRVLRTNADLAGKSLAWTPDGASLYVNGPAANSTILRLNALTGAVTRTSTGAGANTLLVTDVDPFSGEALGMVLNSELRGSQDFTTAGTSVQFGAGSGSNELAAAHKYSADGSRVVRLRGSNGRMFDTTDGALTAFGPAYDVEDFLQLLTQ